MGHHHSDQDNRGDDDRDLTELAAPAPVDRRRTKYGSLGQEEAESKLRESRGNDSDNGDAFLTELASPAPVDRNQPPNDEEKAERSDPPSINSPEDRGIKNEPPVKPIPFSCLATKLYIHSYLIFFSILGTLARLGVEAITTYPNAPFISPVLWANLGGSFFLGFLIEDRRIFREEWGVKSEDWSFHASEIDPEDEDTIQKSHAAHGKVKKTIPLFIGLAVGFCGSFTSFSSFIRDVFLALTNDLHLALPGSTFGVNPTPTPPRNGGYSFEATVAVLIIHVAVSFGALQVGAHVALALDRFMPTLPFRFVRRFLDPLMVVVGFGCWLGAVLLSIWPPTNNWRGRVTFALVFAPPGCLLRFYASKYLNGRLPSFPLGTFFVNIFGTAIIGMCYDLQHSGMVAASPGGSITACQVLAGIMEGFCGCITTVSTWVAELNALRRRHGYIYGLTSMAVALGFLVVIMGSLGWTKGFATPVCGTS